MGMQGSMLHSKEITMWCRRLGCLVPCTLGLLLVPLPATAQPREKIPLVSVLYWGYTPAPANPSGFVTIFQQGLQELGHVAGQTIRLEYRYAECQWDRFPTLAAELVQLKPDVIVTGTLPDVLAAKQATTTIPIVVAAADDLVEEGIVESLARPGGNITGQILPDIELAGKRLEMLKEAAPTITYTAILVDAGSPVAKRYPSAIAREAHAFGVRLQRVDAGTPEAIDAALVTIAASSADALMVAENALLNAHRQHILDFARPHRSPTVCGVRAYAEEGCLIAYAANLFEMHRRATVFVDKLLKGATPRDMPVEQPTKFELVLNLKTAKTLGLIIPPLVLGRADQVIQ